MDKLSYKSIFLLTLFSMVFSTALAQSHVWKMDQGKATNERSFSMEGRTTTEVYKEINRWLVKYYRNPEDNLKARIDGEYLRGVVYYPGFLKMGALTPADLRYTFVFDISEQQVTFKITEVVLIHDAFEEINTAYRLEDYLNPTRNKKKDLEGERIVTELTNFSSALFQSFEESVFPSHNKL